MNFQNIFNLSISTLLALFLVRVFNDNQILVLLIVLGQGHFIMSYFYTNKAGKMNSEFRKKFLILISILSIICFYIYQNKQYLDVLAFFTGVLFILHYYNDEIKIQSIKRHRFFLLGSLASMLAFAGVYANKLFYIYNPSLYILSLLSFVIFFYFSYLVMKNKEDLGNNNVLYLIFFTFLNCYVPTILISNSAVSVYQIFGFIIFFHYFRWYIYYANIFNDNKQSLYFYFKTIFNVHFLLTALSFQYSLTRYGSFLVFIFNPIFFYGWTIMHILLSIRKTDYQ